MLFAEPDLENPASDAEFVRAASESGRVITSMVFSLSPQSDNDTYETLLKKGYLSEHFSAGVINDGTVAFEQHNSATLAYLGLSTSSSAAGCINFVADPDGPSRASYPLFRYRDHYYPSLALVSATSLSAVSAPSLTNGSESLVASFSNTTA